jgi:hypothetical protein
MARDVKGGGEQIMKTLFSAMLPILCVLCLVGCGKPAETADAESFAVASGREVRSLIASRTAQMS